MKGGGELGPSQPNDHYPTPFLTIICCFEEGYIFWWRIPLMLTTDDFFKIEIFFQLDRRCCCPPLLLPASIPPTLLPAVQIMSRLSAGWIWLRRKSPELFLKSPELLLKRWRTLKVSGTLIGASLNAQELFFKSVDPILWVKKSQYYEKYWWKCPQ